MEIRKGMHGDSEKERERKKRVKLFLLLLFELPRSYESEMITVYLNSPFAAASIETFTIETPQSSLYQVNLLYSYDSNVE